MSTPQPWRFEFVRLVRMVDPDTLVARLRRQIDLGFGQEAALEFDQTLRLRGCDLPEKSGATRAMAELAKNHVEILLTQNAVEAVLTWKGDKYGRWLADFHLASVPLPLVALLISRGYAQAYDGVGKRPTWDPKKEYPG